MLGVRRTPSFAPSPGRPDVNILPIRCPRVPAARVLLSALLLSALLLATVAARTAVADEAPLPPPLAEEPLRLETLGPPGPHWLWVNDFWTSKSRLFDADTGRMLGMLDTTFFTPALEASTSRGEVMFTGSYYARGNRGTRTDVVGIYSLRELAPLAEIVLPPGPAKIAAGVPIRSYSGLLDGGRFLTIYNFGPTMSVSIVDVIERTYVGEIDTGGCGLVFPAGPAAFLQLCSDGTVQRLRLDLVGREQSRDRTEPFFDAQADPLMEKAARDGDLWWFVSFSGKVHGVSGQTLVPLEPWALQGSERRDAKWRPGGYQPVALHRDTRRLYVLMHEGGEDTHKDPGTEVWVFDVDRRERVARIELTTPATSIEVTQDDAPLLYATNPVSGMVEVYSALDGRRQRTISETGTAYILQAVQPAADSARD
jgi:methylamine dehydrogenase heavy chain